MAKGFVAKLTPPHVQSAWGSRGKMVRAAGLTACCNYLSKKNLIWFVSWFQIMFPCLSNAIFKNICLSLFFLSGLATLVDVTPLDQMALSA